MIFWHVFEYKDCIRAFKIVFIQLLKTCDPVQLCYRVCREVFVRGHRKVTQQGRNCHALAKVIYFFFNFSSARYS